VLMANQIAGYFKAYPEDDAVAGISDHIKSFWTPGMRRTLTAHLDRHPDGAEQLVVRAMLGQVAAEPVGEHAEGESPIRKEVKGPGELGEALSDAG
jgi:formate dehydrogenase subunit delta